MKTKKYLFVAAAAALFNLSSCVNDLDVTPLDPSVSTSDRAYSTPESYTQGLLKIYSVWALSGQEGAGKSDIEGLDPGNTALMRCWFTLQEQPTDEMKNAWPDSWCADINGLKWGTTQNEPIEGLYQRCMFIVALTNEFLKNIPNAPAEINQAQYTAEARFCRALAYYTLLDAFGIPPFITEQNYALNPAQLSRPELFGWIENELNEIKSNLPAARQGEYGRADQGVVDALLARMYLNAVVYTGTERYTDCVEACKRVIAGGYSLADNGENANVRKEIIFPICFDGLTTQSYGMAAIILGSRSQDEFGEVPAGISAGWDGYRGTPNLVRLFEYANNDKPKASEIKDRRGIFFDKNRSIDITTAVNGTFKTEGWAVYKYTNLKSNGESGSNSTFPDTDFPLFRLADVYLMYAEAVARGGQGGDLATAVGYVNDLRERAYGDRLHGVNEAWLKADNYRNILNERGRELYWEALRRTDLIRFGLFTSASYLWPYKGGVMGGIGVDNRYNVFPIPATDLSVNGSLQQNDGYKN